MDVDVHGRSEKGLAIRELKAFLAENVQKEFIPYGLKDPEWIERTVDNWFDDNRNYDGRWELIEQKLKGAGRVLDMAAGCGTFVLFGLQKGFDVWGIEVSEWKRQYFLRKIDASNYPRSYRNRLVPAFGETLPFETGCFDLVTTYQTLEHVQSVDACLAEMLRILRPGGILYLRAPDYGGFFEPHYRVPFAPFLGKSLGAIYLRALGRPPGGINGIQFVTEARIVRSLRRICPAVRISGTRHERRAWTAERIRRRLPPPFSSGVLALILGAVYHAAGRLPRMFREEQNIDLWITKTA